MLAANKSYQLAKHLHELKNEVSYEDALFATNEIALCINHVLIVGIRLENLEITTLL